MWHDNDPKSKDGNLISLKVTQLPEYGCTDIHTYIYSICWSLGAFVKFKLIPHRFDFKMFVDSFAINLTNNLGQSTVAAESRL